MERLLEIDREILLAINGCNSAFFDKVMSFFSAIPVWIPLYVIIVALFFIPKWYGGHSFTKNNTIKIPIWLIGILSTAAIGICFGLCDQISVIIKNIVERPRPCVEPSLEGIVRFWEGNRVSYGYVSSHAANTFGLAVLTSLIFKRGGYTIFITLWAAVISYSRVYLAKHYPLDVISGAILGIILAICIYYLWKFSINRINAKYLKKCSVS